MKAFILLFLSVLAAPYSAAGTGQVIRIDDLNNKEVLGAARAAVCRLSEESNSLYEAFLIEVVDGTKQVVTGIKYVLTLRVGISTDCRKGEERDDTDSCHISEISVWRATIIHHAWYEPAYEVTDLKQIDSNDIQREGEGGSPGMVGARTPLKDLHDPFVLEAASAGLGELNIKSNSMYKSVLVDIVDGTSQVVAGIKYTLIVLVGISECDNDGKTATLSQCPVQLNTVGRYKLVVWVHPTQPPSYSFGDIEALP